jgi:hypothetical protein
MEPNELVAFLGGRWDNVSFEVRPGQPVRREAYPETMSVVGAETLRITAHGYRDGQDLTKDMQLELRGDEIVLRQGAFEARGQREGNLYALRGAHEGAEFRFRLYTMEDRYVFHRETWRGGRVCQVDMSYLLRLP